LIVSELNFAPRPLIVSELSFAPRQLIVSELNSAPRSLIVSALSLEPRWLIEARLGRFAFSIEQRRSGNCPLSAAQCLTTVFTGRARCLGNQ
jgi:hypothetical protein